MIKRLPPIPIVGNGYDGTVILEVFEENKRLICGLYQLKGETALRPKAWLKAMRAEMAKLESIARAAGCAEMRVAGRDWSRVLTDYQRMTGDSPHLLFKRL